MPALGLTNSPRNLKVLNLPYEYSTSVNLTSGLACKFGTYHIFFVMLGKPFSLECAVFLEELILTMNVIFQK